MDLLREGRPERKALDKTREDIALVRAEIDSVIHADAADDDVMAHCRCAVQSELVGPLAQQFNSLRRSDALLDHLDFPGMARMQNAKLPDLSWPVLICLLGEDRATQVVFAAVKRGAANPPGLPNAERSKRVGELRGMQRKLERAEEIEVLNLESAGFAVLRRQDIDPVLIFEVWAEQSERTAAAA